jgi:hypothetical protein
VVVQPKPAGEVSWPLMVVLIVFAAVVVLLAVLWVACGGGTEEARRQRQAVRDLRRHDQEQIRSPFRRH